MIDLNAFIALASEEQVAVDGFVHKNSFTTSQIRAMENSLIEHKNEKKYNFLNTVARGFFVLWFSGIICFVPLEIISGIALLFTDFSNATATIVAALIGGIIGVLLLEICVTNCEACLNYRNILLVRHAKIWRNIGFDISLFYEVYDELYASVIRLSSSVYLQEDNLIPKEPDSVLGIMTILPYKGFSKIRNLRKLIKYKTIAYLGSGLGLTGCYLIANPFGMPAVIKNILGVICIIAGILIFIYGQTTHWELWRDNFNNMMEENNLPFRINSDSQEEDENGSN